MTTKFPHLKGRNICRTATVPFYVVAHLQKQLEFLQQIGMNVTIVSSDGPERKKLPTGHGLNYHCIEISRSIKPLKDIVALYQLYRFFRKQRFDIVHSTTPKAGLLTAIAGYLSCVPIRLHTWTGQQWVTLKGSLRIISRLADRVIGRLNTRCYADSRSQRQFLIDEGIISENKISVIGEGSLGGVNVERFNPDRWSPTEKQQIRNEIPISPESKVIIFIGRIARDKGVFELVGAFEKLIQLGYDVDLVMVGPFDQHRGGKASSTVLDIQRNSRIHLVGYTETPERYLAIADIFCLPSYREGFGSVVIEAAAMSVPTVGTSIVGLEDAVEKDLTGLLVPPKNEHELKMALQRMLDSPETVSNMGERAKRRCLKHFGADTINHAQAREYNRLLTQYRDRNSCEQH